MAIIICRIFTFVYIIGTTFSIIYIIKYKIFPLFFIFGVLTMLTIAMFILINISHKLNEFNRNNDTMLSQDDYDFEYINL